MALLGAPVAHGDHAQRVYHATLPIQSDLKDYGERLKEAYKLDFSGCTASGKS